MAAGVSDPATNNKDGTPFLTMSSSNNGSYSEAGPLLGDLPMSGPASGGNLTVVDRHQAVATNFDGDASFDRLKAIDRQLDQLKKDVISRRAAATGVAAAETAAATEEAMPPEGTRSGFMPSNGDQTSGSQDGEDSPVALATVRRRSGRTRRSDDNLERCSRCERSAVSGKNIYEEESCSVPGFVQHSCPAAANVIVVVMMTMTMIIVMMIIVSLK